MRGIFRSLPVFAYGAVVNALPYFIPRWLAQRLAHKETDYATVRLLASIVAYPVFERLRPEERFRERLRSPLRLPFKLTRSSHRTSRCMGRTPGKSRRS